jgi:hypothetical protein
MKIMIYVLESWQQWIAAEQTCRKSLGEHPAFGRGLVERVVHRFVHVEHLYLVGFSGEIIGESDLSAL